MFIKLVIRYNFSLILLLSCILQVSCNEKKSEDGRVLNALNNIDLFLQDYKQIHKKYPESESDFEKYLISNVHGWKEIIQDKKIHLEFISNEHVWVVIGTDVNMNIIKIYRSDNGYIQTMK